MEEFKKYLEKNFRKSNLHSFGLSSIKSQSKNEQFQLILEQTNYEVKIKNSIAKIEIIQLYKNDNNYAVDLEFLFSVDQSSCFDQFIAEYDNKILREKAQAEKQFQEEESKGNLVSLATKDDNQNDIMKIKINNLQQHQQLTLRYSYIQPLEVCINKFWQLRIPITLIQRYKEGNQEVKKIINQKIKVQSESYTTSISINIFSLSEIVFIQSPTHLINVEKKQNQAFISLKNQNEIPEKDFILLFKDSEIHKPQFNLIKNEKYQDYPYCIYMSFFPEWNEITNDNDAYKQFQEDNILNTNNNFEINLMNIQGEYIFFLDCSGSMEGTRIEMAINALIIFLKSLPLNSYFNILQFGTSFNYLFKNGSVEANQQNIQLAIEKTKSFQASFGGTNILSPLKYAYKQPSIKNYPRYIFLLTDGCVENEQQVLKEIQNNNNKAITCTLGIGNFCSNELIKEGSRLGNGVYQFVGEGENDINEKVIYLLEFCISPYLENFLFNYDNEIIAMMTPNINSKKFIRKNQQLQFYIFLKKEFEQKKSTTFTLSYDDQSANKRFDYQIQANLNQLDNDNYLSDQIYKIGIYNFLQNAIFNIKNEMYDLNDVILQKKDNIDKLCLELAVSHQILTEQTSFIAIFDGTAINDIQYQQKQKIEIQPQQSQESYDNQQNYYASSVLTNEQIQEFKEAFDLFSDKDNGIMTTSSMVLIIINCFLKDFGKATRALGLNCTDTEIQDMINSVDCDGSGTIDFAEFLSLQSQKMRDCDSEEEITESFKVFDKDGSGNIKSQNLIKFKFYSQ